MKTIEIIPFLFLLPLLSFGQHEKKHAPVVLHSVEGYGEYEAFAHRAAAELERVINSDTFEILVKRRKMKWGRGLENWEIYNLIMQAQEEEGPGGEDGVIDLRVRTINENDGVWLTENCPLDSKSRTIGIDGGNSGVTAICPQRLELWAKENRLDQLAGHYMHEYMHMLGFEHGHPFKYKSAVYKIGRIVRELVAEGEEQE